MSTKNKNNANLHQTFPSTISFGYLLSLLSSVVIVADGYFSSLIVSPLLLLINGQDAPVVTVVVVAGRGYNSAGGRHIPWG